MQKKTSYEIDSQKKGNIDISCQENGLLLTDTFSPMLCKGQEKQLRLLLLCVCGIDCNSKKVMPYCCNRFITPCNTYIYVFPNYMVAQYCSSVVPMFSFHSLFEIKKFCHTQYHHNFLQNIFEGIGSQQHPTKVC